MNWTPDTCLKLGMKKTSNRNCLTLKNIIFRLKADRLYFSYDSGLLQIHDIDHFNKLIDLLIPEYKQKHEVATDFVKHSR